MGRADVELNGARHVVEIDSLGFRERLARAFAPAGTRAVEARRARPASGPG